MAYLKVCSVQCGSCIFGPNSAIAGRPERMRELERAWKREDTHQICHHFGVGEGGDEALSGEDVVCRGFYDTQFIRKGTGQMLRIAERLGAIFGKPGIEFVDPPDSPVDADVPAKGRAKRKHRAR